MQACPAARGWSIFGLRKVREILDQPCVPKPDAAQKAFGFTNNFGEAKLPGN